MRKCKLIFIVIIILAVGGYSAFWYTEAKEIEENAREFVEKLNNHPENDVFKISADKIYAGGYPFKFLIKVDNLRLSMKTPNPQSFDDFIGETQPEMMFETSSILRGTSSIGSAIGSDVVEFSYDGEWEAQTSFGEGKEMGLKGKTGFSFELEVENLADLVQKFEGKNLFKDDLSDEESEEIGKYILSNFRRVEFNSDATDAFDAVSGKKVMHSGDAHFKFENRYADGKQKMSFKVKAYGNDIDNDFFVQNSSGLNEMYLVYGVLGVNELDVALDLEYEGPELNMDAKPQDMRMKFVTSDIGLDFKDFRYKIATADGSVAGIDARGTMKKQGMNPNVDVRVALLGAQGYPQFLDYVAERLTSHGVIEGEMAETMRQSLSEYSQVEKVLKHLAKIEGNDFVYEITATNQQDAKINGKPAQEAMMEAMQMMQEDSQ